jgi:hypothetical protein
MFPSKSMQLCSISSNQVECNGEWQYKYLHCKVPYVLARLKYRPKKKLNPNRPILISPSLVLVSWPFATIPLRKVWWIISAIDGESVRGFDSRYKQLPDRPRIDQPGCNRPGLKLLLLRVYNCKIMRWAHHLLDPTRPAVILHQESFAGSFSRFDCGPQPEAGSLHRSFFKLTHLICLGNN